MFKKFFSMFFILCFSFILSNASQIESKMVQYGAIDSNKINGFLAQPKVEGNYPALILIHEWWGLNDDIKAKAKEFAALGYVALAIDLYNGKSSMKREDAKEYAMEVRGNMDMAFANINSAMKYLQYKENVNKNRVGSIGWCFGGGWSYQMAKNNLGVKTSVIYYGAFNPKDDLSKMRADIIGHFAELDRVIKVDKAKEFQIKLKTLKGDHEVYIYPNTTHGFASREGDNKNYSPKEAQLAWERTIEFLKNNL